MTNDIDDINDIQRHNIGIGNYLTIHHVRNAADGRSGQSRSFMAGKPVFQYSKVGVSRQENLSARKHGKRAVLAACGVGK